jgi:hypothetical protein
LKITVFPAAEVPQVGDEDVVGGPGRGAEPDVVAVGSLAQLADLLGDRAQLLERRRRLLGIEAGSLVEVLVVDEADDAGIGRVAHQFAVAGEELLDGRQPVVGADL